MKQVSEHRDDDAWTEQRRIFRAWMKAGMPDHPLFTRIEESHPMTDKELTGWRKEIADAADIIEKRGICYDIWFDATPGVDPKENPVCAVGAVMAAQGLCTSYHDWDPIKTDEVMETEAIRRLEDHWRQRPWNWIEGKTAEEVAASMRELAYG